MTFWGAAALVCAAFAMLLSNISTVLPKSVMTGLHATRIEGGNLNHLRSQVAALEAETSRIRIENNRLMTMMTIAGEDQTDAVRRIGALESSLPDIMESIPAGPGIDRSLLTAGIGDDAEREFEEAEGGTVAYTVEPLEPAAATPGDTMRQIQEMPQIANTTQPQMTPAPTILASNPSQFGIALGPQVTVQDAYVAWKDITNKAGTLLIGLGPLLSGNAGIDQQRLVAGPINDYAQAEQICIRMIRIGISCLPVPYAGNELPE